MAGTSGLLKSAASVRNQLAAYQDQQMAFEYKMSGYTDSAFTAYTDYLRSRVNSLSASGSIANASKALSLTSTMDSAMRSNVSASISRASDAIMQGSATSQDKLALIQNQYLRALDNQDMTLAQSLASRADSLSQTIQLQEQTAQQNAITLAKAQGASNDNAATQFENGLHQLNADVGAGGMAKFNSESSKWVAANKDKFLALADSPSIDPQTKASIEKAVSTSQPSYQDIVAGTTAAIMAVHLTAANALYPYDPQAAQGYYDKYAAIANGTTKMPTLAGSLTAQDIQTWQQQPGMFTPHENTTGGKLEFTYKSAGLQSGESAITGYQFDQNGNLVPQFAGGENGYVVPDQATADKINNQLKALGANFQPVKVDQNLTNGITTQFSDKTPQWLKDTSFGQKNLTTQMYMTPQGLQFGTLDSSGQAHGYLITQDQKGLNGLYNAENVNGQLTFRQQNAKGDYGFNQNQNSLVNNPTAPAQAPDTLQQFIQQVKNNGFNPTPQANGFSKTPMSSNTPIPLNSPLNTKPSMSQRFGGGYNFTNAQGQAISAATYSQLTNTPFRTLLQTMSNGGDTGAQTALGFVGNDYGYDPTKAASYQNSSTYNALTWGAQGVKAAPANAPASVLGNGASLTY
jgi:hypothetical protein